MISTQMETPYTITQETKVEWYYLNCSCDGLNHIHSVIICCICAFVCSGSVRTIRVGSRSLPLYPLVIVCLGLLNTILLLTAIVIGIYCEYDY